MCIRDSLDSALDVHKAALRAGDRAADDEHVQVRVDLDDVEVLHGDLLNAHLACADLTLEDTGRIRCV